VVKTLCKLNLEIHFGQSFLMSVFKNCHIIRLNEENVFRTVSIIYRQQISDLELDRLTSCTEYFSTVLNSCMMRFYYPGFMFD
jgi:hypothetical protein